MRKLSWAVLCLAVVACEKKTTTTAETPKGSADAATTAAGTDKPVAGDDIILIGEVGSLTGSEAAFGISTRNGIDLAIEEANEAGGGEGKKVVVSVFDCHWH